MTTPTPRRPRRSLEQREADAKAELQAIEDMRASSLAKTIADAHVLLRVIEKSTVPHGMHEHCRQLADKLASYLSSAKPGEGK